MTDDSSNTAQNSETKGKPRGKPFVKGDPRINRNGRPKSFDALRELARAISHEKAVDKSGETVIINGHSATVAEMILRQWATSKNPRLQQAFIEVAFGKVPDRTELTGKDGGPVETVIEVVYVNEDPTDAATAPSGAAGGGGSCAPL